MWRAQLERQQQAARKGGRIGWIGKAGPGVVTTSTKKGVGYWSNDGIQLYAGGQRSQLVLQLGRSSCGTAMKNIEFVPMIWDDKDVNPKDPATVQTSGKVLLTFNNPMPRIRRTLRLSKRSVSGRSLRQPA